ncbi:hypothetical protein ACTFIY_001083 [Dictyostelium cf. discoideum]
MNGPSIHSLGNNTDSPYLSYQTLIDIKKSPFQWLKGHQVSDKFFYPGMGYVNNLLSIYPNQDITISSLEFKSPFVLTEGNNQSLQTTIIPLSKNEFNIKNKCNFTSISKQDLYETIRIKTNLTYKGLFQGVNGYCKRSNNIKSKFQSESFETNKDNLYIQLNSNLEYKLYIEIEVKATGINYKDYLMYIGMIGTDLDIKYGKEYEIENGIGIDNPNIGNDFSGIITRLGSNVKKYKVGDQVKLMELGEVEQHGVDLILNTLSSEFMDSNFQSLNMSGRIVDLSITHLTPNDYMTNNHYKFNMGYNNVEVVDFPGK